MLVLGIESTCDESAASLVRDGKVILSNVIASQVEMQKQYGGVFPEMASRAHVDAMMPVITEALLGEKPDLIAVANRPGLMGSILMGVTAAEALSLAWNVPLVGVNHVEAHLYAAMMDTQHFPALGVVVSGGHTHLVKVTSPLEYEMLGQTVDDAIGEAFDKVARMMNLGYPGGPEIEKLAKSGDPKRFPFRGGRVKGRPLDFSFSGLKTNVLYSLKELELNLQNTQDIAASFQRAAFDDIYQKTLKAAEEICPKAIYLGGGVTNSVRLQEMFQNCGYPVYFPQKGLSLDNGAMIAGLGYHVYQENGPISLPLATSPRL
ncbi:MAG: tRNA N6-adenosine threonylcarbamoyltransferase [Chlamydiia bacterium]|nr:tRNA N6-adenosine threonylcarbamoyltransferase [Chlamydiia bacterium]MCH9615783.1 tRNA N6-adenosine threonylcarbamoyltransferase [Chlamydiia bacterium]MCH9628814.1 tRNA N6-adenosine threonylcarbamoyltransferase [Chlamydiia bacterium]